MIPPVTIEGVHLQPLRVLADERGAVLHVLRADSPLFHAFGEVYLSEINPGALKGWKRHRRATQHLAVPRGRVRFAFHDDRPGSSTRGATAHCELGRPDAYALLVIPPQVWYAWRCLGEEPALIINCSDVPHDPAESEQRSELQTVTFP